MALDFDKMSVEDGLKLVSQSFRAPMEKSAMPGMDEILGYLGKGKDAVTGAFSGLPGASTVASGWNSLDPISQNAIIGGGIGTGVGALGSVFQDPKRRRTGSNMLSGALLGALGGGAYTLGTQLPAAANSLKSPADIKAEEEAAAAAAAKSKANVAAGPGAALKSERDHNKALERGEDPGMVFNTVKNTIMSPFSSKGHLPNLWDHEKDEEGHPKGTVAAAVGVPTAGVAAGYLTHALDPKGIHTLRAKLYLNQALKNVKQEQYSPDYDPNSGKTPDTKVMSPAEAEIYRQKRIAELGGKPRKDEFSAPLDSQTQAAQTKYESDLTKHTELTDSHSAVLKQIDATRNDLLSKHMNLAQQTQDFQAPIKAVVDSNLHEITTAQSELGKLTARLQGIDPKDMSSKNQLKLKEVRSLATKQVDRLEQLRSFQEAVTTGNAPATPLLPKSDLAYRLDAVRQLESQAATSKSNPVATTDPKAVETQRIIANQLQQVDAVREYVAGITHLAPTLPAVGKLEHLPAASTHLIEGAAARQELLGHPAPVDPNIKNQALIARIQADSAAATAMMQKRFGPKFLPENSSNIKFDTGFRVMPWGRTMSAAEMQHLPTGEGAPGEAVDTGHMPHWLARYKNVPISRKALEVSGKGQLGRMIGPAGAFLYTANKVIDDISGRRADQDYRNMQ